MEQLYFALYLILAWGIIGLITLSWVDEEMRLNNWSEDFPCEVISEIKDNLPMYFQLFIAAIFSPLFVRFILCILWPIALVLYYKLGNK